MNKNLDIIKEELLNSNISAAIIDEEWGIGKTHELLKIKEDIENDNTESKKWTVIYLKIADLKNISIREHCFLESKSNMKSINSANDLLKNAKGNIATISSHFLNSLHEKNVKSHSLDNHLIIIDEIERIPNDMDIKSIFNQIFELKESLYNIKILISLCSDEFETKNKRVFQKWNDKISDINLLLKYDAFNNLITEKNNYLKNIFGFKHIDIGCLFKENSSKNIRKLKILFLKIDSLIEYIKDNLDEFTYVDEDSFIFKLKELLETNKPNYKNISNHIVSHYMIKKPIKINDFSLLHLKFILERLEEKHENKDYFYEKNKQEQNNIIKKAQEEKRFIKLEGTVNDYSENIFKDEVYNTEKLSLSFSLKKRIEDFPFFFNSYFIEKCFSHNKKLLNDIYMEKEGYYFLKEYKQLASSFDKLHLFIGLNDFTNLFEEAYIENIKFQKIAIPTFNRAAPIEPEDVFITNEEFLDFESIFPLLFRFKIDNIEYILNGFLHFDKVNEELYYKLNDFLKCEFNEYFTKEQIKDISFEYKTNEEELKKYYLAYQAAIKHYVVFFEDEVIENLNIDKCFKNISN